MEGRFASTVLPGDALAVKIWRTGDGEAVFQTWARGDTMVIDQGRVTFS